MSDCSLYLVECVSEPVWSVFGTAHDFNNPLFFLFFIYLYVFLFCIFSIFITSLTRVSLFNIMQSTLHTQRRRQNTDFFNKFYTDFFSIWKGYRSLILLYLI